MMITIHGFPAKTKYQDVKMLIKQECNINDFILDNLISDTDGTKKVRIGLTDNTEGYKVMKCLDGFRMPGNFVLKAIPIGKTVTSLPPQPSGFDSRPSYQSQPRNDYSNAPRNDYMGQPPNDYNNQGSHGTGLPHSHGGNHGSSGVHESIGSVGSHGSRPSQGGPHGGPHVSGGPQSSIDSMNRPSPWVAGGGESSQWNTPMVAQVPQNTFGFTSPPANVNPSYGQQQVHPRSSFNQGRADQGYGYTPKSNVPEVVPANSRYRWVRNAEQEPTVSESPHSDEDSASSSSTDDNSDKESHDVPNESEKPPDTKLSNKERKKRQAKLRDLSKLNGAKRRRFYFWIKQGKSFMEARELCEISVKNIPEYPALKAEQKKKNREMTLRQMSPERQVWTRKIEGLKGRVISRAPAEPGPRCKPIPVRFVDELGFLSREKVEMLLEKILELIEAETDENGPMFVNCRVTAGTLVLSCGNAHTLEWLENHLPNFQLWEPAQVKIINQEQSSFKPAIGIAYVTDPNLDEEAILQMLKSQNQGMIFSDWRICSMKPDPPGQTVTFNFGQSSIKMLAERNNHLYLGIKKIKIRIKQKKEKAPVKKEKAPVKKKKAKGKKAKGKIGKPPKGQQGMLPLGQWGMMPMDQMGMGPMNMGQMRPMDMGHMGQMNMEHMGPMGFVPTCPPYPPDFSQPRFFGGGYQPRPYHMNYYNRQKKNRRRRP